MASDVEFIRLNGEAIRVTSLRRENITGTITLVVVARGTAAGQQLAALGQQPSLQVEVPGELTAMYRVAGFDQRSAGERERVVHRVTFTLVPAPPETEHLNDEPAERETQLDRIERKLDDVLRRLSAKDYS